MQNVWRTGPTPTEQPTGIMIAEVATETTETTGREATPASTADSPAISLGRSPNRGRNNDRGRGIDGGENNIGAQRREKVLFATTARRAAIFLGTATFVTHDPFRTFRLVL
jgi:hypothetical protein